MPDLLLVDGGVVQLRTALAVLRELGITGVAAAGLAKIMEEIYAGDEEKIRRIMLPKDSPALQLLQRLRDEAHRFAVSYHRRLRAKLIRESALDEISGLGKTRKRQLLGRFGSLRAIAGADKKEIASVPGIGPVLAHKIKLFLNKR
jgi:excinuclease ABC subunit C